MATKKKNTTAKKKGPAKKAAKRAPAAVANAPAATTVMPEQVRDFLKQTSIPKNFVNSKQIGLAALKKRLIDVNVRPTVPLEQLVSSINRIKPAAVPIERLPQDVKESIP